MILLECCTKFDSKYEVRLTNILVDASHNKSKGASNILLNHAFAELKKENIISLGWSVRSNNVNNKFLC